MGTEKKLKVAIVGAGFWGRNHARVLSEMKGVELHAVCDIDEQRAIELARRFNVPSYYRDFRDVVREDEVDAVIICTTSITHAEICKEVLKAGKDVLVEKPMAADVKEALEVVDAVKSSRRKLMVGFIERFNPAVKFAEEAVNKDKVIGEPLLIYSRRIGPWPERIGDIGVVKDTAIHDIDLSMLFLSRRPINVYAAGGSLKHKYEDHVQALLDFGNGKGAVIEANWLTPRKKRELSVTGTHGVLYVEYLNREVTVEKSSGLIVPSLPSKEPLRAELEYFVSSLLSGKEPVPSENEGLMSLLVAEAVISSMKTRKIVSLDEIASEYGIRYKNV